MPHSNHEAEDPAEHSLGPMLSVRNGSRAIEFYLKAFGARELFHLCGDDGSVVAHLSVDGGEFWVSDESPEHLNFSPETLGGSTARMILVVEDPDAVFQQALAAGASLVSAVDDQPYGWRVGRVLDPFGHHWEIGKRIT